MDKNLAAKFTTVVFAALACTTVCAGDNVAQGNIDRIYDPSQVFIKRKDTVAKPGQVNLIDEVVAVWRDPSRAGVSADQQGTLVTDSSELVVALDSLRDIYSAYASN